MKKTYIAPIVMVDEAETDGLMMIESIHLSDEVGSEEYTKEDVDYDWDDEW